MQITFAGRGSHGERRAVHAAGFAYHGLPCPADSLPWGNILKHFKVHRHAARQAKEFLQQTGAVAVVGLGDLSSLPIARAAIATGIALALLEQNAIPGKATQKLSAEASLVCLAFAASRHRLAVAREQHGPHALSEVIHIGCTPQVRPIRQVLGQAPHR